MAYVEKQNNWWYISWQQLSINLDLSNKSSFFSNPGIPAHCSATAADLKHGMGRNNNWGLRLLRQQLELFGTWKAPVAFGTKDLHIERWHNTEWSMVMSFWSPEISDFPLSPHTTSGGWFSTAQTSSVGQAFFVEAYEKPILSKEIWFVHRLKKILNVIEIKHPSHLDFVTDLLCNSNVKHHFFLPPVFDTYPYCKVGWLHLQLFNFSTKKNGKPNHFWSVDMPFKCRQCSENCNPPPIKPADQVIHW